jgi:lipoyl(octanoyl) transferase
VSKIEVKDLGLIDYELAWKLQKELIEKIKNNDIGEQLLICEHNPVITYGKSSKKNNLLINENELLKKGIKLFEVERGGDITFHEPGQLVAYPILNLNNHKRDVHWYMRQLEEVVINTLSDFNLNSERIESKTGVWIEISILNHIKSYGKIASLGVKLSRWCTMHGIALNVTNSLDGFNLMNPCGLDDVKMVSMKSLQGTNELKDFNFEIVKTSFVDNFLNIFD